MKQLTLRIPEHMHTRLIEEMNNGNGYPTLQQHIIKKMFSDRMVYRTNYNGKIQVRFSLTSLGDMLVMGRIEAFNGAYAMMKDAINNKEQVIIELLADNDLPIKKITFESLEELEKWYKTITQPYTK